MFIMEGENIKLELRETKRIGRKLIESELPKSILVITTAIHGTVAFAR